MEVRDAGAMGMGIFAKRAIEKDTLLCEYTGRLLPINPAQSPTDSTYTWHVTETCRVDSAEYGNIGRFSNHHCTEYNCDAMDLMYGRRKVMCYKTRRDIAKGEQILVNYGLEYFHAERPCRCTAADGPHLLGHRNRVRPVPTKKLCWEAVKKLAADKEKKNKLRRSSRSPEPKPSKLTRKAGVLAHSKL